MLEFELLTVAEVAAMLRYSSATVYKLIKENKLKYIKRGKVFLVRKSSVTAYLNSMG